MQVCTVRPTIRQEQAARVGRQGVWGGGLVQAESTASRDAGGSVNGNG